LRQRHAASVHVHVRVDHAGQHGRGTKLDEGRAGRDLNCGPDLRDPLSVDQHDLIIEQISTARIEEMPGTDGDDLVARREVVADALGPKRRTGEREGDECNGELGLQPHQVLPGRRCCSRGLARP